MVEQYIPNIVIQVQVLSKSFIFIRELSLMVKHMTFNHYYMSSNPIALIKTKYYKRKKFKGNDGIGRHE